MYPATPLGGGWWGRGPSSGLFTTSARRVVPCPSTTRALLPKNPFTSTMSDPTSNPYELATFPSSRVGSLSRWRTSVWDCLIPKEPRWATAPHRSQQHAAAAAHDAATAAGRKAQSSTARASSSGTAPRSEASGSQMSRQSSPWPDRWLGAVTHASIYSQMDRQSSLWPDRWFGVGTRYDPAPKWSAGPA